MIVAARSCWIGGFEHFSGSMLGLAGRHLAETFRG